MPGMTAVPWQIILFLLLLLLPSTGLQAESVYVWDGSRCLPLPSGDFHSCEKHPDGTLMDCRTVFGLPLPLFSTPDRCRKLAGHPHVVGASSYARAVMFRRDLILDLGRLHQEHKERKQPRGEQDGCRRQPGANTTHVKSCRTGAFRITLSRTKHGLEILAKSWPDVFLPGCGEPEVWMVNAAGRVLPVSRGVEACDDRRQSLREALRIICRTPEIVGMKPEKLGVYLREKVLNPEMFYRLSNIGAPEELEKFFAGYGFRRCNLLKAISDG